jgi:hypothetical protein
MPRRIPCSMQHTSCNMQHAAGDVQHCACDHGLACGAPTRNGTGECSSKGSPKRYPNGFVRAVQCVCAMQCAIVSRRAMWAGPGSGVRL